MRYFKQLKRYFKKLNRDMKLLDEQIKSFDKKAKTQNTTIPKNSQSFGSWFQGMFNRVVPSGVVFGALIICLPQACTPPDLTAQKAPAQAVSSDANPVNQPTKHDSFSGDKPCMPVKISNYPDVEQLLVPNGTFTDADKANGLAPSIAAIGDPKPITCDFKGETIVEDPSYGHKGTILITCSSDSEYLGYFLREYFKSQKHNDDVPGFIGMSPYGIGNDGSYSADIQFSPQDAPTQMCAE